MDQSEPDLPSHLGSADSRIENKDTMTGETEENFDFESGRIIPSSPIEAEFGDSPSDRAEEMVFEYGCHGNWEEENFPTSCETDLDAIALPCSANYDEMNEAYKANKEKKENQMYSKQSSNQSPSRNLRKTMFDQDSDSEKKGGEEKSSASGYSYDFPTPFWNGHENETQPPAESPSFNADLENLFSTDQQGDVLSPSAPGVCGLCNLGNTCFMNSGLQCLLNTPTMVQFFIKQIPEDTANPESLASHFTNLFHKVWSGKYSKVKPTEFHNALGTHHPQFKDYRQHDCQEFLALVLGSLHELLNTASSKSHVSDLSADPMTPHSTCEEDRDSSGTRNPMQENTDHDSGSQMALSITGLRCEASSSSHSSESSIGASQIRMRPLPEDVQPFKSVQPTNSVLWEAMDSITEGTDDNMSAAAENNQSEENLCVTMEEAGSNIISDNALKKDSKSVIIHDKNSKLEKNEVASLNNIPQCFRGYEDILKDAKTSNVNVLVTEQGANNEIVFDSDKFPKHESTRRRDALENPNLTEFHNFEGKTISIKRIKETNKLHDQTETSKEYLAMETFYNSNNKRFKLAENLEKEKNLRMEIERKLSDDTNGIDQDGGGGGEFSGAAAVNNPINVDDELEADKQWEKHLGHNQSVIVDSFQGQFKSTIVCSECHTVSSTYEPFMYLSVPLPHAMEQQICVTFVPANSNFPIKFLLTLNKQDKIIKIKEHLRKVLKANVSMNLELAEVLHHHIARILDENLFIRYLGINDPNRSIYAFEISDDVICSAQTNQVTSTKEDGGGCQTETTEPLDLTPEQGSPVESNFSKHKRLQKTVKLNNVETRRISKTNETETKSNISSTINNNLKSCSEPCVNNLFESTEDEPVEYGPQLEHQIGGGGDAWANEANKSKPMETNESGDWKSCAICLEEVERGLKNHKGCSCFLCDNCIERSVKHYSSDESTGLMKCPVCNELVDPKKVFVVADDVSEFRTSIRMLKVPVLFRQDLDGEGNNNEKGQKLFGHPHLIKVANRLKGSELYEVVGKLVPYNSSPYSLVLVDGQGYHCSRCMYTVHCKGCKISEDAEISLQTGDNLAVRFTSSVIDIPAIDDYSMEELRNQEQLSLYDCLDAFSESETLDEHNPWYCPTCQRNQCATKTLSVWRYPDFLIVYLKRFVFHEYTSVKLDNKVSFPLTGLNLVPPSRIQQGTAKPYNLYACVNHFGGASAGHYTAYAKNPQTGDWHLFNDETVTAQKPQEEDYCNAYVLFYQKQGVNFNRNLPNSFLSDATAKPNIEQLILDLDSSVEQDAWPQNIAQTSKT